MPPEPNPIEASETPGNSERSVVVAIAVWMFILSPLLLGFLGTVASFF